MKTFYSILLFVLAGLTSHTFAQVSSFTISEVQDSTQGCLKNLSISLQIGANNESGATIYVYWDDATTETYGPTAFTANTNPVITLDHGYSIIGSYEVTVAIWSATDNAPVGDPLHLNWNAPTPGNCGFLYIYTYQPSPNVPFFNVPYDFIGANGTTTTIYPSGSNGMINAYTGLNIANAPYTISINNAWLEANGLIQTSQDTNIFSFNSNGMADLGQITMTVSCNVPAADPDFTINYSFASAFVAPLQTGNISMNVCNYACSDTSDATVTLECPAGFIPNTSGLTNAVFTGNVLTFDLLSLSECSYVQIPFTFPGNTPAGSTFQFYATVNHPNDTDLSNNTDTIYATIFNSYDPNDKTVDHPEQIDPDERETLQYMIQFQNEGNSTATDVIIQDTISTNLVLSTLTVLGAKHGIATSINPISRVVTFSFNDINLVPASQDEEASKGYVVYSIWEYAGLPLNSEIENTAYIYFDFNPAIITNTTYNINSTLGVEETTAEFITLYPNPANTSIQFKGAAVKTVEVFDITGKKVAGNSLINTNELSVAHLSNGVYQVVIHTEKRIYTEKLIIRK